MRRYTGCGVRSISLVMTCLLGSEHEPAVDVEYLSGDPSSGRRAEQKQRAAQVSWLADRPHRGTLLKHLPVGRALWCEHLASIAVGDPGSDAVDGDACWSELTCECRCQSDHRQLGDSVDGLGWKRARRRLVDDSPAAPVDHRGCDGLGALPGAGHVHREGAVPIDPREL